MFNYLITISECDAVEGWKIQDQWEDSNGFQSALDFARAKANACNHVTVRRDDTMKCLARFEWGKRVANPA